MTGNLNAPFSLPGVIALMYHRIDNTDTDPWGICVSPDLFDKQVKFLKDNFHIISVKDLVSQLTTGNITGNSICLTFDDGYADNYSNAKPVLETYDCPATFFIPTAFISHSIPFWWDELEMIFLHSKKLPHKLSLQITGKNYNYLLDKNELTPEQWIQHKNWRWHEKPPTDRCAVFLKVWEQLRALPYEAIKNKMNGLKNWAHFDSACRLRLPVNKQQLCELAGNNLFSIGMHTHTHADLEEKGKQEQREEINTCKKMLYNKYKIESNCLSYPFGKYNNDTIEVVNELQIAACFTTESMGINAHSALNKLGRYQVFNRDIKSFKDQLNTWNKSFPFKNKPGFK